MFLVELCVRQPGFAAMLIACLVAVRLFSCTRLGLDLRGAPARLPDGRVKTPAPPAGA